MDNELFKMRDFIWQHNGVIYVSLVCRDCSSEETMLRTFSNGKSVCCKNCGQSYYKSLKEARFHYPKSRVVLLN